MTLDKAGASEPTETPAVEVQHTPLPWHFTTQNQGWDGDIWSGDVYAIHVAELSASEKSKGEIEANSAFIVKACNEYDAMVARIDADRERLADVEMALTFAYDRNDELVAALRYIEGASLSGDVVAVARAVLAKVAP